MLGYTEVLNFINNCVSVHFYHLAFFYKAIAMGK